MKKIILTAIISGIICGTFGVFAGTYNAKQISFTPSDNTWKVSNVAEAIEELKIMNDNKISVIWENANPSENFVGQSIDLDLTKYSKIYVKVGYDTTKFTNDENINYVPIDIGVQKEYWFPSITTSINAAITVTRTITTSNTSIAFSNATAKQGTSLYYNYNDYCIPLAIYGVK